MRRPPTESGRGSIWNKPNSVFSSDKARVQLSETSATRSSNRPSKHFFDIEGINTEDFGYKVVITGGPQVEAGRHAEQKRRRRRYRNSSGCTNVGDLEAAAPSRWYSVNRVLGRRCVEPESDDMKAMALQVHTTQSVEVRKSYQDNTELQVREISDHDVDNHDEDRPSRVSSEVSII